MDNSVAIMRANGVSVDELRAVDHEIPPGVQPDMTEHGFTRDEWPEIQRRVLAANILVVGTPIWLGDKTSVCTSVIERLYGYSGQLNDAGQWIYYGRVGGVVVTGNEDGIKHVAMNVLYSLQHLGYVVPPQADCGWIGEAGPGPSYADPGSRRSRERIHAAEHHLHDVEPHASRGLAQARRWDSGVREPARRMGRGRALRPSESRVPLIRAREARSQLVKVLEVLVRSRIAAARRPRPSPGATIRSVRCADSCPR